MKTISDLTSDLRKEVKSRTVSMLVILILAMFYAMAFVVMLCSFTMLNFFVCCAVGFILLVLLKAYYAQTCDNMGKIIKDIKNTKRGTETMIAIKQSVVSNIEAKNGDANQIVKLKKEIADYQKELNKIQEVYEYLSINKFISKKEKELVL